MSLYTEVKQAVLDKIPDNPKTNRILYETPIEGCPNTNLEVLYDPDEEVVVTSIVIHLPKHYTLSSEVEHKAQELAEASGFFEDAMVLENEVVFATYGEDAEYNEEYFGRVESILKESPLIDFIKEIPAKRVLRLKVAVAPLKSLIHSPEPIKALIDSDIELIEQLVDELEADLK